MKKKCPRCNSVRVSRLNYTSGGLDKVLKMKCKKCGYINDKEQKSLNFYEGG